LNAAPINYQSCHGVKHTPENSSIFKDDEYVIYDTRQQRLKVRSYLFFVLESKFQFNLIKFSFSI